MQAYRSGFAKIYNLRWGGFARQAALLIQQHYESQPAGENPRSLLDLCCGAGHLARHFLDQGYQVTCLDLSPDMLEYARQNTAEHIPGGRVRFVQADAAGCSLTDSFGLVVSTYDALNHLPHLDSLKSCFACTYKSLAAGGMFIFDLNTRVGLQRWNNLSVEDNEDLMLVNRGIFDEASGKAWTRLSGFVRQENGLYERFEETVYNTIYPLSEVQRALLETGFRQVYSARLQALETPLEEPEQEGRVFFVARKA
jgi:SAM-dependent methyltransferase